MTIRELLDLVDDLKPNDVGRERKIGWLSDIERRVYEDIIALHEQTQLESIPKKGFTGYTEETDESTKLLVPEPYCELYRWYLEMQIDLVNMELAKHNNSLMLFENAWREYAGKYHRTHLPKCDTNFKY